MLMKLYLSWFGIAKLINPGATFKSITTPTPDITQLRDVCGEIMKMVPRLQSVYLPQLPYIPLVKRMRWVPTWKSTPISDAILRKSFGYSEPRINDCALKHLKDQNIFINLKRELAAFVKNAIVIKSKMKEFRSPGILWFDGVFYPLDPENNEMAMKECADFHKHALSVLLRYSLYEYYGVYPLGRLSQVIEGGGKRRIFAICNSIKQRLLRPVHDWSMTVLSTIPCDGTFNQPLMKLKEKRHRHVNPIFL